jgi:Mg2+-importing ATPase
MVIRTHRPFFRSKPGRILAIATLLVAATTITLPYTALGKIFGLVPLPWHIMFTLIGITTLYLLASELLKRFMFARLTQADSRSRKRR